MIGKGYQLIKYYYIYYSLGAKLKRFISRNKFFRAMRTQKNEVDVSDRALAATFDQSLENITGKAANSLEQLCIDKPEQAAVVNHYAKRVYELLPLIPSFFAAIIACVVGITAVKFEDGYLGLSGKDKLSRIFANPIHVNKVVMPDNSLRSQWKIRTMIPGAHPQFQQMVDEGFVRLEESKQVASKSPSKTARRDPRITEVGWYLRKLSVDEAPQVFQWIGQYFGKGWRPSPNNLYFFGNRSQICEALMNVSPEEREKLTEGPYGLVGLDCIGRGKPGHGNQAYNNHRYSKEYKSYFILPTDLRIGKGLIKAILSGSNS